MFFNDLKLNKNFFPKTNTFGIIKYVFKKCWLKESSYTSSGQKLLNEIIKNEYNIFGNNDEHLINPYIMYGYTYILTAI